MNIICTSKGIVDMKSPRKGIQLIQKSGFQDILADFSLLFSNEDICDGKSYQGFLNQFFMQIKEADIRVSVAYAPFIKGNWKKNNSLLSYIKETIISCGEAGCEYIVIRPLSKENLENEAVTHKEYYLNFLEVAKKYKMKILLENQYRDFNSHFIRGAFSEASEAADLLDQLNVEAGEERFGFCMNVGNSNLCAQNPCEWVKMMGSHLKAVLIRDCDGNTDNELLPYSCVNKEVAQTPWPELLRGLREIEFNGALLMNFASSVTAFPPSLRLEVMKFAKTIAEYFVWQIDSERKLKNYSAIVLFGAGNMCKNYMNVYGETNRPLFTCDNNSSLWGKNIYGLEVKEPSALLTIDKDCAIFICNIYYQEIEKQLQEMGIHNPIERFTDENMTMLQLGLIEG